MRKQVLQFVAHRGVTTRLRKVRRCNRFGATITESIVAATLLTALIGAFAPLSVRSGRLWQQTRHHQLALDELSNVMDSLIALPPEERQARIEQLTPSAAACATLPAIELTAMEVHDQSGQRLILAIDWQRVGTAEPLTLVGWISTMPKEAADE